MPSSHSPEEMRQASDPLLYEIWMFKCLAEEIQSRKSQSQTKDVVWNAVLDAFLIRARMLIDFFYKSRSNHDDDVLAVEYFSSQAEWKSAIGEITSLLKEVKEDVHISVAHLSHARSKRNWPTQQIYAELSQTIDSFLNNIPPHLLGPRWEGYKPGDSINDFLAPCS